MNTIGTSDSSVTSEVWNDPRMRDALAERNVSEIFRRLRKHGVSQRQIAVSTGQSQSEVSEILKGRQVQAYDVLARIADGLGIPRGYMGLAYDGTTALRAGATASTGNTNVARTEEDDILKRRQFLSHAASVTMGAAVLGQNNENWVPTQAQTPAPAHIGMTEVQQIQATTKALRDLDYRFGGGTCRDAVVAQLSWAQQLMDAQAADPVRRRLFVSLADMHSLAGWTSFDTGLLDPARTHFARALELAKQADDDSLVASVLYRMGRVYLHHGEPNEALKLFQLGQLAAQNSGSPLTVAVLYANQAWAYGMMDNEEQTKKMLGRTRDEFARADRSNAPNWVSFFGESDVHAMAGSAYDALAVHDPQKYAPIAVGETVKCNSFYEQQDNNTRSHVFGLIFQATNHIRSGDLQEGLKVGRRTLELAPSVKSQRVVDRIKPLQVEAAKQRMNPDARDLADQIQRFRQS